MNHLKIFQRLAVVVLVVMMGFSSRLSAQTCPTSNELTITVIPEATITTAGATTICAGGNATLTATPAGGTGTCTIQWQSSTDGITWANITGATSTTLNITALGATTSYHAVYTCSGSGCDAITSNSQTVTVNPDLSITANLANITECIGGNTQLSITTTGGSGSALTYTWEQSTNNSTWSAATAATNATTYTPSSTSAGTMYYRVRVSDAVSGCDAITSAVSTVIVTPDLSITANLANITECIGGTTQLSVTTSGGSGGALTYTWEQSTNNSTWSAAASATNASTYTPSSATAGTMYYRVRISDAANGCDAITSATSTTVVTPDLSITSNLANITECIGGTTQLSVTTSGGSGGALTYTWEQSTDNSTWSAAASATNASTYTPSSATAGVMYYRVRISDAANGCDAITAATSTVTITPDLSIIANLADITECVGGTTQLTITTTGGSGGVLTYTWEQSSDNSTWGAATGATNSNTYTPSSATAGVMYYRVRVSDAASGCDVLPSAVATVTINPDISISTQPADITECVSGNLQLSVTASGGVSTLNYQWEESNNGSTWADISGATSSTYTPPSTTAGVKYYRVRISNAGNGCQTVTSNSATVTVVAKPTIAIAASTSTICVGGGVELSATPVNGTGTCVIQWQNSTDSGASWNDIPAANGTTYTTPALNSNTTYRAKYTCSGNGCCN